MTDFLNCPFCGEDSISVSDMVEQDERRYFERTAECVSCEASISRHVGWGRYCELGAESASAVIKGMLVKAWNSRYEKEIFENG
jgi:transcriptional regulator NrdR family protein